MKKEELEDVVRNWIEFSDLSCIDKGDAGEIRISHENKEVVITVAYSCEEFYVDFNLNGEPLYADWYESMDDPLEEIMEYTRGIVERYINYPIRVKTTGWLMFKRPIIEYQENGAWKNVFM